MYRSPVFTCWNGVLFNFNCLAWEFCLEHWSTIFQRVHPKSELPPKKMENKDLTGSVFWAGTIPKPIIFNPQTNILHSPRSSWDATPSTTKLKPRNDKICRVVCRERFHPRSSSSSSSSSSRSRSSSSSSSSSSSGAAVCVQGAPYHGGEGDQECRACVGPHIDCNSASKALTKGQIQQRNQARQWFLFM